VWGFSILQDREAKSVRVFYSCMWWGNKKCERFLEIPTALTFTLKYDKDDFDNVSHDERFQTYNVLRLASAAKTSREEVVNDIYQKNNVPNLIVTVGRGPASSLTH